MIEIQPQENWKYIPYEAISTVIRKTKHTRQERLDYQAAIGTWLSSLFGPNYWTDFVGRRYKIMKFIDLKLSVEQREQVAATVANAPETILASVNDIMADGYRFTAVYDADHDCVIVSLMGRDEKGLNYGLCMTSRHRGILHALGYAVFKHLEIFDGKLWAKEGSEDMYG